MAEQIPRLQVREVFSYSYGDPVYYPRLQKKTPETALRGHAALLPERLTDTGLRLVDRLGRGGFLGAWGTKSSA
jgi:hypothetical protein